MVIVLAGLLLVAFVGVAVVAWWRSPARVEYRIDRRALRRLRRRWRRLRQTEDLADDVRVRRVDHLLALATQACGARRRSTGPARWIRCLREPRPVALDTPFERRYLAEAEALLDQLTPAPEAPLAEVVDVRDARSESATDDAVAESA